MTSNRYSTYENALTVQFAQSKDVTNSLDIRVLSLTAEERFSAAVSNDLSTAGP